MSLTLRIFLIVCSIISFVLCIRKIKQAKLKVTNSVIWLIGCTVLIFMAIFSDFVGIISRAIGFIAPVNFVFLVLIGFLLIQVFIDNIRISMLNEKVKELDHYIALREYDLNNKKEQS